MAIATNIETGVWKTIIRLLMSAGWTVAYKYDNIDAGVDFDFIILENEGEEIMLGWDNWVEGELKCSEEKLKWIEEMTGVQLNRGEPVNLKPSVIALYKRQRDENL